MKKKVTKVSKVTKKLDTKDNLTYQNGVLLNENAALVSECAMLRSSVLSLQSEVDRLNEGKHCGKDKTSHWFYDNRCKPSGGASAGRVFEEAK